MHLKTLIAKYLRNKKKHISKELVNAKMDSKWIRKVFVLSYKMSVQTVSGSVLRIASVLTKIKDSGMS